MPYGDIIDAILVNIGENTSKPNTFSNDFTPNRAKLTIAFVPYEQRNGISSKNVIFALADLKDFFSNLYYQYRKE